MFFLSILSIKPFWFPWKTLPWQCLVTQSLNVTPWEWRTYRKFFDRTGFLNTAARRQSFVLFMCDVLCYSHKINEKMYLDFRNASILKRGKISLLCPCKKEFVVFQNGRRMAGRILTVLRDVSLFQAFFWLLMVILSQETMSIFVGNNNRMSSSWKIPGIWPFRYSVHVFPGKMVSLAYYWLLTGGYKGEKMYEVCLGFPFATMYFSCMGGKGIWKYRRSLRFWRQGST